MIILWIVYNGMDYHDYHTSMNKNILCLYYHTIIMMIILWYRQYSWLISHPDPPLVTHFTGAWRRPTGPGREAQEPAALLGLGDPGAPQPGLPARRSPGMSWALDEGLRMVNDGGLMIISYWDRFLVVGWWSMMVSWWLVGSDGLFWWLFNGCLMINNGCGWWIIGFCWWSWCCFGLLIVYKWLVDSKWWCSMSR